MSAIRAGLSCAQRRTVCAPVSPAVRLQHGSKRFYQGVPTKTSWPGTAGAGGLPLAVGGTFGVMSTGLYVLGRDPRDLKHSDHVAQQELNPKKKYRDSRSTRWVDWHVKS